MNRGRAIHVLARNFWLMLSFARKQIGCLRGPVRVESGGGGGEAEVCPYCPGDVHLSCLWSVTTES